ncbi:hypothetical protein VPH35_057017 [Triticum aestivum]|uniref:NB-ARC domain-containing protein n=1 Tax=Triticum aestivum TaxID=4565 RepID=A0A3B6G384_WHEAT
MDAPDSDLHMEMEDPDLEAAMGFPVTASLGPVGPLLRQLRELTTLHNVVSGDEIQGLTEHLHGLCVSLMHQSEAEAEEPLNSTAKCWMREVRELCYDTNNYLNDAPFISKQDDDHGLTPQEKQENAQFEFKMLVARAKSASKRRQRCEINHKSISKTTKLSYTGRGLPVLHPELIDRGRMDELADMLGKDEEKQLKVVSLVGLEGVGKTTLAKRVYHKTVGQFQCRAFVRVSPNPDMRRLLTNILWQIQLPAFPSSSSSFSEGVTQPASCLDAQDLITNIQDYLRHKSSFRGPEESSYCHSYMTLKSKSSETTRPTLLLPSSTTELTTPLSCQSNQMLEPWSQTPPSTTTTTLEVPTTTCSPLPTTKSS